MSGYETAGPPPTQAMDGQQRSEPDLPVGWHWGSFSSIHQQTLILLGL